MKSKQGNSIVILLGMVHGSPVVPCAVEMKIQIFNSIDLVSKTPQNNIAENIKGYLPRENLEELLNNLRNNISICYHGHGVDTIIKEEDST
jgi:hypothetical protein